MIEIGVGKWDSAKMTTQDTVSATLKKQDDRDGE